jgi:hypothetical protein
MFLIVKVAEAYTRIFDITNILVAQQEICIGSILTAIPSATTKIF